MAARILLSYTAARGLKLALPCPMEDRGIAAETLLVTLDDRTLDRVIASAQALKASRARDAGALRGELLDKLAARMAAPAGGHRYYTFGPPDAPGAAPGGAVDWQDFGEPIPVEGLGLPAHGWVEYDRPLSPGQAKAHGLRVIKDL